MDNRDASDAAATAAESARRIADAGGAAIDSAKEAANEQVKHGVEKARGSAEAAAQSLRRAAGEVEAEHAWIGAALRKSADSLEAASQSLAGGDLQSGLHDLNGFARRQPAVFLGAAFALGFAMARVGKTAVEKVSDARAADSASYAGYQNVNE